MKFRIEGRVNDGRAEAPPFEVDVADLDELVDSCDVIGELANDEGRPFGPGATLLITRLE